MDKVTKQKNPKRQAAGRKSHEKYMAKLKEDILKNVGNSTNDTTNTTSTTTNNTTSTTTNDSTTTTTISTNFSYIHGVGAIAVLALGIYIFITPKLMTNQTTSRPQNKSPEKISKIR